jgi:tetratricopeptide (TPR) repeat protein
MKKTIEIIFLALLILFYTGCGDKKTKDIFENIENGSLKAKGINVIYPKHSTIFPPEFPSPTFEWSDSMHQNNIWYVFIANKNGEILIDAECSTNSWKADSSEWEEIKEDANLGDFSFTVISKNEDKNATNSGRVQFSFSADSVGAEIFFRAVTLPFSYAVKNVHTIEWYMGSVKGGKPRKMLHNLPVCGNCHSFSRGNPLLAMDVDYGNDKGSYAITEAKDTSYLKPENIISWSYYKKDERNPTFGLLSQIAPNGQYVLSTIKDLSVFVAVDSNLAYSQLFFPIKGVIGIYNMKTKSFSELEGANDPKYVQSNPSWSPDSKNVVFAKTEAYVSERVKNAGRALLHVDDIKEFTRGEKKFKYSLYSIAFNDGKGGKAQPIKGASFNGKSNYFPKYSPDGKWIVFCQAENFMLLQPDSRLYIMPSEGGVPREMNCNMDGMNSWHSWSPNSRWLIFSSKNRGLYTQLYLTHIDQNGNDSPPILLENLQFEKRAANIPEFFPGKASDFKAIKDAFSNTAAYYLQLTIDNLDSKYYKRAWDNISKSIALDSTSIEAYFQRILLNGILKQSNSLTDRHDKLRAGKIVDSLLNQSPNDDKLILLSATLQSISGNTEIATNQVLKSQKINPKNQKSYELLCSIYRKTKQYNKLLQVYQKMKSIYPADVSKINSQIAVLYEETEKYSMALDILNNSIKDNQDDLNLRYTKANILLKAGKPDLALKEIDFIIKQNKTDYKYDQLLFNYYTSINDKSKAYNEIAATLDQIDKQIASNSEDIELLFEKANILLSIKRWNEAEETYSKILNIFPNNYEALKGKAKIKLANQQWSDAITIYNLLENNYQSEEEFFNNRAIAYINMAYYEQALVQLNKAIKLNPNNFDARYNKYKLLSMMGNAKLAQDELRKLQEDMKLKKKNGTLKASDKELLQIILK